MDFLEIAKTRYTTKKYDGISKINEDIIEKLKDIIRLSPSSINSQPWKFSFIDDKQTKQRLAEASYWNAQKINDASHLVVFSVIDDLSIFEHQIKSTANQGNIDYYTNFIKPKGEGYIKSWLAHQVYLSLGFFLPACASLEIDSTPMEGIENEKYDDILQLEGYKSLFAVAIGYRDSKDVNQPLLNPKSRLAKSKSIHSI